MENGPGFKSDRILEEIRKTQSQTDEIQEIEEHSVKLVIFTLAGGYYALHGDDVKEILPLQKVYYVPGTPEFILGIINVRGDIQSVFDIRVFMRLTESETSAQTRVVIAEKNSVRSGVLVDSVVDVLDVPQHSIQQAISTLNDAVRYFVVGELAYKHHTVTLLDIGKLFEKVVEE